VALKKEAAALHHMIKGGEIAGEEKTWEGGGPKEKHTKSGKIKGSPHGLQERN